MKPSRIDRLERIVKTVSGRSTRAKITYKDGSERVFKSASDIILILRTPEAEEITCVSGNGEGNGKLIDLLNGLITERNNTDEQSI
ncbi:MAG: hypothetical protein IKE62_01195 [Oscillospiraceae bacterium]|nr:hypothetical protein [Oscillospiraceae bacterium]